MEGHGEAQPKLPNLPVSTPTGEGVSLVPDHYRLRADPAAHKLRDWQLQGSPDGRAWQTLRCHQDDASLSNEPRSAAAWPIDAGAQAFRHFRVLQTGGNSSGSDYLACAGIELYGRANFARPFVPEAAADR